MLNEPLIKVQDSCYSISGNPNIIKRHLMSKNILREKVIGPISTVSIYDIIDARLKRTLETAGLEISRTPLQDWFVDMSYYISNKDFNMKGGPNNDK